MYRLTVHLSLNSAVVLLHFPRKYNTIVLYGYCWAPRNGSNYEFSHAALPQLLSIFVYFFRSSFRHARNHFGNGAAHTTLLQSTMVNTISAWTGFGKIQSLFCYATLLRYPHRTVNVKHCPQVSTVANLHSDDRIWFCRVVLTTRAPYPFGCHLILQSTFEDTSETSRAVTPMNALWACAPRIPEIDFAVLLGLVCQARCW